MYLKFIIKDNDIKNNFIVSTKNNMFKLHNLENLSYYLEFKEIIN